MKNFLLALSLLFIVRFGFAQTRSPLQLFPGLFEAVQLGNVFPDNKTFVDATPKKDPAGIMQQYRQQKGQPGFDLKKFVLANFYLPQESTIVFKSDISAGVRKHIDTLWHVLSRKHQAAVKYASLLALPNDFVVPGGRFREMYYWDSYFTMLGLQQDHQMAIVRNMLNNFAYLLDQYGFIPNGTRTYYLTRSQPPFFSMMVDLLAKEDGDKILIKYQPELLKEYSFWMAGADRLTPGQQSRMVVRMPGGELLNRYWDDSDQPREESFKADVEAAKLSKEKPQEFYRNIRAAAASGWDFSTRWFGENDRLGSIQTTDIVPVDLNCLLYHLELTIANSYRVQGNKAQFNRYQNKAQQRKQALLKYCWSDKDGWFMDYNWKARCFSTQQTLAGMFPLEFEMASTKQVNQIVGTLVNKFMKPGGLVTSLKRSGQQWDSPNAWAPLQYIAIDGLNKYHQSLLARTIALRWIATNTRVFKTTGKLMEKYDVVDANIKAGGGEYALQDGFGWTNGVLLYLMNKYGKN